MRGFYKLQCPVQYKGVLFPGSAVTKLVYRGSCAGVAWAFDYTPPLCFLVPCVVGVCGVCKRLITSVLRLFFSVFH